MPTIEWPPPRGPRRRARTLALAALAVLFLGGGTAASYYVDALWFGSLGFSEVFWTRLTTRVGVFAGFAALTFVILYGAYLALKPPQLARLAGGTIIISGQPVRLPVGPVIQTIAVGAAAVIAIGMGLGLSAQWATFALYWVGQPEALGAAAEAAAQTDPIFGRPLAFYFFTLPAWRLLAGWLTTLSIVVGLAAIFFTVIAGGARVFEARRGSIDRLPLGGVSAALAALLLMFAFQVYLARFDRILADHRIFTGITYTDANITIRGLLLVSAALAAGAVVALVNAVRGARVLWLAAAVAPAVVVYLVTSIAGWYVTTFIVRPNELTRERPFIAHNIELTRRAYGLHRIEQVDFDVSAGPEALGADNSQESLDNVRLWDWRALQDTLRQIQMLRTYYDFADVDIDRYEIDGSIRQVMLAVRELNAERLPESSRTWVNQKLVYTHGYGLTMNTANGFTREGLPQLVIKDMPIQSTIPGLAVSRPEIYFGELTNTDVYVRTRQQEFNYPEGDTNTVTTYEGDGGIELGGRFRRLAIALDRGDITTLPFSNDVHAGSRLLMRRNIRDRVEAIAPFLLYDTDPYIVIGDGGRLFWMIDAFTVSDAYPYSRHYRLDRTRLNYIRNSVKVVIDAYDGTVAFYVFDAEDPVLAAHRAIFPVLFRDASAMPETLRKHVRYPELLIEVQASVYGPYHMGDPAVFYNREDLWSVATEVSSDGQRGQVPQPMEPNFVLMRLPGEDQIEFVEVLPFTPANRNNLIGWIAGRSDDPHYGKALVYHFRPRASSRGRCRSRRVSTRIRRFRRSSRCGVSRDRTCAAAACW